MTKEEKKVIVSKLQEQFSLSNYFYVVDASGLTVEEINDLRRKCFQQGVVYQVAKNTLISKALKNSSKKLDDKSFEEEVLKGFSGVLFSQEIGNMPAKIIKEFRKQRNLKSPILKGASIDGELFIGEKYLDTLSNLKSKQELIGEIVGLLQSPMSNLLSSLQSAKHKLAGLMVVLSKDK